MRLGSAHWDGEEEEAEAVYRCTFVRQITKSAKCLTVKVDQRFWWCPKHLRSVIKDEMKAYYELYLSEHPNFRAVLSTSAQVIGEQLTALGEGQKEVERVLHHWLLKPILAFPALEGFVTGGRNSHLPLRIMSAELQRAGPPSFYAGWRSAAGFTTVAFMSDCYDTLASQKAFQQAILLLGQTSAEAVVAGLNHFSCFCLCTREFVQFGAVHSTNSPQHLFMTPLTRRLLWTSFKDRRRMAEMALGISCWLRRLVLG